MGRPRRVRAAAVTMLVAAGVAVAQDAPPPLPPPPLPPPPPTGAPEAPAAETPPGPTPGFTPPPILAQRRKGLKEPAANAAVAAGLDWLRRHQSKDGRWDCDGFDAACTGARCSEAGMQEFDSGVTALAVLAFLGTGATHVEGPDAALLARALRYLTGIQDSDGCFGSRTSTHFQYNHRVATMAVAEALWLTGDEKLVGPAAKARDFVLASQNPFLGWRYGVRDGDNDTSAVSYSVLALRTCEFAHLEVPRDAWAGPREWFDKMTDPNDGGVGYQWRGGLDARAWVLRSAEPAPPGGRLSTDGRRIGFSGSEEGGAPKDVTDRFPDHFGLALTAAAGASMTLVGGAESAKAVDLWASARSLTPPSAARTGFLDLHSVLFGSLFHAQRPFLEKPKDSEERKAWRPWRDAVVADLTESQATRAAGCAAGSWDPDLDPFGCAGGRVYSTAMAVLALEAPNRFPRVWDPKAKPPKPPRPEKPAPK